MSRGDQHSDHITPYDRFAWSDTDIEQLLATGGHANELITYFGTQEYEALSELARQGAATPLPVDAPRVYIVPGIMGSQLGLKRRAPTPHDILWLDPIDIGVGRLAALKLSARAPAGAPIVPLGVVLFSYLRLKLYLRRGGLSPVLYDYDWRCGVDELGASLAQRIKADPARRVMIVAHSMGGLLVRTALAQLSGDQVERAVLLGTPNLGSFAPLQALRGTYSVVRRIARLVNASSAEQLAEEIFSSFPSLYQMLPVRHGELSNPRAWPQSGPQPNAALLRDAARVHDQLPTTDPRISTIVGVGQETVTAATRRGGDFVYTITRRGDGTVPADSASLPGLDNYYSATAHSELTRDAKIAAAVIDILQTGATRRLPTRWRSRGIAEARISDTELRRTNIEKVDWASLPPDQRRLYLETLNEPPKLRLRVPHRSRRKKTAPRHK